jgi:hypothetical protein
MLENEKASSHADYAPSTECNLETAFSHPLFLPVFILHLWTYYVPHSMSHISTQAELENFCPQTDFQLSVLNSECLHTRVGVYVKG